ncbi:MAG: 6-pyruvoyl tetrahydropterin synthase family protein [Candidatus Thorarchaeota archaeon]|nr:6-pyruvoyl tetrahydropterin synthase family protein [Candidatus Thorarchaeota archaeon]
MPHSIRVARRRMTFSAAHFVVSEGECECLHGHNYSVEVTVSGPLDEQGMVLDFRKVQDEVAEVCRHLDHRLLLPGQSRLISVEEEDTSMVITAAGKTYVIPSVDCVVLPIKATTAELLAQYVAQSLSLSQDYRVEVCVSESAGSTGCFKT